MGLAQFEPPLFFTAQSVKCSEYVHVSGGESSDSKSLCDGNAGISASDARLPFESEADVF